MNIRCDLLTPETMSNRGSAKYRSQYYGGTSGPARGSGRSLTSTKRDRLAYSTISSTATASADDELPRPPGNLVVTLQTVDISPSGGLAQISNFQCIASYNWLDSSEPVILVPGVSVLCHLRIDEE